ncbi:CHAD domain-containing protein [Salinicola aestuarinus]|uniref:CHAD domain-containing protein n=1 Tax=Salinicola aestuarinus TaxID=1949082 RepID=UPI000DA2651F|nr:CHAD domain-containing protein [Salinicola aestuarinus]
MPYRLKPQERVQSGIQRIALEQLERAAQALEREPPVEAVHELRRRCKKLRALVRLVRPALGERYTEENLRYRDLARRVAGQRDDQVLIETFEGLLAHYKPEIDKRQFTAIRQRLSDWRERSLADMPARETLIAGLSQAKEALNEWQLSTPGFDAVVGWEATYARGREALATARVSPTTEALHALRKRVKYHRYHCALLTALWSAPLKAREAEAHRLSDCLGEDHDLAVLAARLDHEAFSRVNPERLAALERLIQRRRDACQAEAWPLGRRLFAEPPKPMRKRLKRYWKIAHFESACHSDSAHARS